MHLTKGVGGGVHLVVLLLINYKKYMKTENPTFPALKKEGKVLGNRKEEIKGLEKVPAESEQRPVINRPFEVLDANDFVRLEEMPAEKRIPIELRARLGELRQTYEKKIEDARKLGFLDGLPPAQYVKGVQEPGGESYYNGWKWVPSETPTDYLRLNLNEQQVKWGTVYAIKDAIFNGIFDKQFFEREKNNPNKLRDVIVRWTSEENVRSLKKILSELEGETKLAAFREAVESGVETELFDCDFVVLQQQLQREIDGLANWSTTTEYDRKKVKKEWDKLIMMYDAMPEGFEPSLSYANKWIWEKKAKAFARDEKK